MQHFPVFLALTGRRVALAGGGEVALAKLRLLLKTEAKIEVFAAAAGAEIRRLAAGGHLVLRPRAFGPGDGIGALLVYAATENPAEDRRVKAIAEREGALVNVVDDLQNSAFITPAIVDRDPVCIAIGTEGAAPVLARQIKEDLEARLPESLGLLARSGKAFRGAAEALPHGKARRDFWADYYLRTGPRLAREGAGALAQGLRALLQRHRARSRAGLAELVGIGPGETALLTLAARKALDEADLVIHAPGTPAPLLDLARREARRIETRDSGAALSALIAAAEAGEHAIWLLPGMPDPHGAALHRLAAAGIAHGLIPGLPLAAAAEEPANLVTAPRRKEVRP